MVRKDSENRAKKQIYLSISEMNPIFDLLKSFKKAIDIKYPRDLLIVTGIFLFNFRDFPIVR